MTIYVYQKDYTGHIEMVSADKDAVYKRAWEDFINALGLDYVVETGGYPDVDKAFEEFVLNGGIDDWEVSEWEV